MSVQLVLTVYILFLLKLLYYFEVFFVIFIQFSTMMPQSSPTKLTSIIDLEDILHSAQQIYKHTDKMRIAYERELTENAKDNCVQCFSIQIVRCNFQILR